MTKEQLEQYLESNKSFGTNIEPKQNGVAWIILSKRKPLKNFFERFTKPELKEIFLEQEQIKNEPYNLWFAEITKEAFSNDKFPQEEDYIMNKNYSFSSLAAVDDFLKSKNLSITDLKWISEVDFL